MQPLFGFFLILEMIWPQTRYALKATWQRTSILRAWRRAPKALKPENTRNLREKTESHPRVGPPKVLKNTPQKTKLAQQRQFLYFFVFFSVFFVAQPRLGILYLFVFDSYFQDSGALLALYQACIARLASLHPKERRDDREKQNKLREIAVLVPHKVGGPS